MSKHQDYQQQSQPRPNSDIPILNQPVSFISTGGGVGVEIPLSIIPLSNDVPPGLEYLTMLDSVFIKQDIELIEIFLGCETKNRYNIKSAKNEIMFRAKEENDFCTRQCCGPIRPFDMYIKDHQERTVIHINRPFNCDSCCYPCCLQVMEVFSPPGTLVGRIEQKWSIFPKFEVKDASGGLIFKIDGPLCTCSCTCGDVDFKVMSADGGTEVGKISKKWSGFIKEAFTDADNFGITFPVDLHVQVKAVLIGACFLIDFMYFEKSGDK